MKLGALAVLVVCGAALAATPSAGEDGRSPTSPVVIDVKGNGLEVVLIDPHGIIDRPADLGHSPIPHCRRLGGASPGAREPAGHAVERTAFHIDPAPRGAFHLLVRAKDGARRVHVSVTRPHLGTSCSAWDTATVRPGVSAAWILRWSTKGRCWSLMERSRPDPRARTGA